MSFSWINVLVLGMVVLPVGCGFGESGPALVEATGVVNYAGKPLGGAIVTFIPKAEGVGSQTASGMTNDAGEFRLKTGSRSGAVSGAYQVVVSKINPDSPLMKDPRELRKPQTKESTASTSLIPLSFADPTKSGFAAEVRKENSNAFTIELNENGEGKIAQ